MSQPRQRSRQGRLGRPGQAATRALGQRKAEAALRRSRDYYLTLFEEFPALIWRSGVDARCDYVNRAWLNFTGRTLAEELGDGWQAAIHPADLEYCVGTFRQSFHAHMPFSTECRLRHHTGEYRWIRNIGQPFPDLEGRFAGYLGVGFDLDDQRQWFEELRQSQSDLRALARRLQSVREEEGTRLSREMHDVLGQNLTGLKMDLAWLQRRWQSRNPKRRADPSQQRLTAMTRLVDETIQKVRDFCAELRPGMLDELGLVSAVEWLVKTFEQRAEIRCELTLPTLDVEVNRDLATAVFRILQEILSNVARHARATRIQARLGQQNGLLILEVRDNGRGITPQDIQNPASLGLLGMHERALAVGGTVNFQGTPQAGTTVTVRMPLAKTISQPGPASDDSSQSGRPEPQGRVEVPARRRAAAPRAGRKPL